MTEGLPVVDCGGQRGFVNYPKLHIKNGEAKNSPLQTKRTEYKPTVRMFKNARNYASERGLLPKGHRALLLCRVPSVQRYSTNTILRGVRETYYDNIVKYLGESHRGRPCARTDSWHFLAECIDAMEHD